MSSRRHISTMTIALNSNIKTNTVEAKRESYTTGGIDPTHIVRWTINGISITEFQGDYDASSNGDMLIEKNDETIVNIHQGLEAAYDLLTTWLAPPYDPCEEDPMGGPERYK